MQQIFALAKDTDGKIGTTKEKKQDGKDNFKEYKSYFHNPRVHTFT
ncbi:MAG TPA: hypothetical protein HPP54_09020 [Nitrospinae bacterium]|nr:hypothetical protein [Nitrospinota bacterium]